MQQRRVRLGDILDDYCPRERRITNHAVVAMIDDTVKQTRCTTCDADHEYREGKAPAPRRRPTALAGGVAPTIRPRAESVAASAAPAEDVALDQPVADSEPFVAAVEPEPHEHHEEQAPPAEEDDRERDEWPAHRRLIRATLPRPEGQVPERKAPEFTFRPTGGRFDARNGQRKGGHRPTRHAHGPASGQGQFRGSRGAGAGQQGPRHGAGQGQGQGQRGGNRPAQGQGRPAQGRGPRPGGSGRKRGR